MGFGHIVRKTVWYGLLGVLGGSATLSLMQVAETITQATIIVGTATIPVYSTIGVAMFGIWTIAGFAYGYGDAAEEEENAGALSKKNGNGNSKNS